MGRISICSDAPSAQLTIGFRSSAKIRSQATEKTQQSKWTVGAPGSYANVFSYCGAMPRCTVRAVDGETLNQTFGQCNCSVQDSLRGLRPGFSALPAESLLLAPTNIASGTVIALFGRSTRSQSKACLLRRCTEVWQSTWSYGAVQRFNNNCHFHFILEVMSHPHFGTECRHLTLVFYYKLQESSTTILAAQRSVSYPPKETFGGFALYCLSLLSPLACVCQAKIKYSSPKLHRCCTQLLEDKESCHEDADHWGMRCLQWNDGRIHLLTQGISVSMSSTTASILLPCYKLTCQNATIPARVLKVRSEAFIYKQAHSYTVSFADE